MSLASEGSQEAPLSGSPAAIDAETRASDGGSVIAA